MGVPLVGMGDGALIPHGNIFAITPNPHPNLELEPVAPLKDLLLKNPSQSSPLSCPGEGLNLRHSQGLQTALQWLLGIFLIFFPLSSTRQSPKGWKKKTAASKIPPLITGQLLRCKKLAQVASWVTISQEKVVGEGWNGSSLNSGGKHCSQ